MKSERQWRRIQEYLAAGNFDAAQVACISLIQSSPSAAGWQLLATLETRRGRYRAARAATVRAAEASLTSRASARLAHLTQALLAFDEWHWVQRLVTESDWATADIARQAPVLAQHLSLAGDDEGCLRFCEAMRSRIRADPRLEYMAGLAARNVGSGDAAEHAFERAIELDPHFAPAHWSLAYHRPRGESRIPRVERALATAAPDTDEAVELCYALYRENEAAGRVDDAWRWLAHGMSAKAELVGAAQYPVEPQACSASLSAVDSTRAPIIFVVGLPRTGTTVLERMLGNHPAVRAAGELNAFHAALCDAADRFLPSPSVASVAPDVDDPTRVGAAYRASIARLAEGGRIVIDKNPANFVYAARVAEALPEARILCLRRHPLDACFSNLKELFPGDAYPYSYSFDGVAAHIERFERMRTEFEALLPGRFMTVSYEAMVADPRSMAEQVFGFCGLDYVEGSERIERNASPVSTASSTQVREPLHGRGVGAWQRYAAQLEPLRRRLADRGLA